MFRKKIISSILTISILWAYWVNVFAETNASDENSEKVTITASAVDESYVTYFIENFDTIENPYIYLEEELKMWNINKETYLICKNFINKNKKEKINKEKEIAKEKRNEVKEERKKIINEKKENMQDLKILSSLTEEQKEVFLDLTKELELKLKELRESLNKENIEDIKAQAETLKNEYIEKANLINEEVDLSVIIINRFDMFFQNQFVTKEKLNNIKEESKKAIWEIKKNSKELKDKYKEKFKKSLGNVLGKMSNEQLTAILTKIEDKIRIVWESNISQTNRDKILTQLNALHEIIQEEIDLQYGESINLEEIIPEITQ